MTGCSAINCKNRTENGVRLFRFPANAERKVIWLRNMRRGMWFPNNGARLCEIHFEKSQFENNRKDGLIKLKPNAIPTLFNVPNPPHRIDPPQRKSLYKNRFTITASSAVIAKVQSGTSERSQSSLDELQNLVSNIGGNDHQNSGTTPTQQQPHFGDFQKNVNETNDDLKRQIEKYKILCQKLQEQMDELQRRLSGRILSLQKENQNLQQQLDILMHQQKSFLNDSQIQKLNDKRVKEWSNEAITKGLKLRFAVGISGYEYLRSTGYPTPSYSTLMRRIQEFKLDFGIFGDVLEVLKCKVETMEPLDRFCIISYDEMQIGTKYECDKTNGKAIGHVTLDPIVEDVNWIPSNDDLGEKMFIVLIKGVKNNWKQVIASHITRKGLKTKNEETKVTMRQQLQDFILQCITAVESCGLHVISLTSDLDAKNKSIWSSLGIQVSANGVRQNSFIHNNHEIYAQPDICHIIKNLKSALLRLPVIYLPKEVVELEALPSTEVRGSHVIKLWEDEISSGLETRLLHHLRRGDIYPDNFEAMHVGAAIRFFSPKTSSAIVTAVKQKKLSEDALTTAHFIMVIYDWFTLMNSRLRKTSISTRNCDKKYIFLHSVIDLFQNTVFDKNWKPLNYAIILTTLSFCDTAEFLFKQGFDFILGHRFTQDATENTISQIRKKAGSLPSAKECLSAVRLICVSQFISDVKRSNYMSASDEYLLEFCKDKKKTASDNTCSTNDLVVVSNGTIEPMCESSIQTLSFNGLCDVFDHGNTYNTNATFYIAGSTTRAVQKNVCFKCMEFLSATNLPRSEFIAKVKCYTVHANRGGLIEPCFETLNLIFHCEYYFNRFKHYILKNGHVNFIELLTRNVNILFPPCCDVKRKIIKHFCIVRSLCLKSYSENCNSKKKVYGTASCKTKKR